MVIKILYAYFAFRAMSHFVCFVMFAIDAVFFPELLVLFEANFAQISYSWI